jgi:hypothetical protein
VLTLTSPPERTDRELDSVYPSEGDVAACTDAFIYDAVEWPPLDILGRESPVGLVVNGETEFVYGRLRDCVGHVVDELPRDPGLPSYWEFPVTIFWFERKTHVHIPGGYFRMMLRIDLKHRSATLGRHEWSLPITGRGSVGLTDDTRFVHNIFKTKQVNPVAIPPTKRQPNTYWQQVVPHTRPDEGTRTSDETNV